MGLSSAFLVILKPTKTPEKRLEALVTSNLGFPWVKEAAYLLVDTGNTLIHDCDTNTDTVNSVISFIKEKQVYLV